ncbi:hypothetical protein SAMN05421837_1068 [Amycolatopsis pretoriensis]|uniref:Secreted protein n=1 Tax=Amycolatopsis pretoriensis TaxID=218821 RepID=A0A1H5R3G2_9PSEU|nr:hypothetical protein [Amycolatopsis pretoriensis]SEF31947.1 hypothetical protein SAMN05421837_1068 [Amycolatopsis pretoriensis]
MRMTKIGRPAAVVLCAGALAVAVPDVVTASPAPPALCVAGVYRVQAWFRHTPSASVRRYTVERTWIPFGTVTCGGASGPA